MTVLALLILLGCPIDGPAEPISVRIPIDLNGEFDLADLIARTGKEVGVEVDKPALSWKVPARGAMGARTLARLGESLGRNVSLSIRGDLLILTVQPVAAKLLKTPLEKLSEGTRTGHTLGTGFRALDSYRPNDLKRPTVCLVHGLNSSSHSFVHLIPALEREGFGVVVHDYPYNRDLDSTVKDFTRDWKAFRASRGERLPWAIVTHSMGTLPARWYVEGEAFDDDVCDLIMIAPPNHGAAIATAQTMLELIERFRAVRRDDLALARLNEGLGEAAVDLTPGSPFLRELNSRPIRKSVRYHILAGDRGFIDLASRKRIEARIAFLKRAGGMIGGVTRIMEGNLDAVLDEMTDTTGDGCVTVESTKLAGVEDHVVIHSNHVALIRGPMLFADEGPIDCLSFVLERLQPLKHSTGVRP